MGATIVGILTLIGRYLFLGALVLLAIIYLSYLGLEMATGVPLSVAAQTALGESVAYVSRLLQGDLGLGTANTSINNPVPVSSYLWPVFSRSLGLLALSLTFAATVGLLIGLRAATRGNANRALPLLLLSIVGVSMPSFFVALLLQRLVIRITQLTGVSLLPVGGFGWDSHIILPALVLAAAPCGADYARYVCQRERSAARRLCPYRTQQGHQRPQRPLWPRCPQRRRADSDDHWPLSAFRPQ